MSEQIYAIYLNDYSCPSCCSGIKTYFGTMGEISDFIEKLAKTDDHPTTVEAFHEYLAGNVEATHGIAYIYHPLMNTAELICSNSAELGESEWKFMNAYQWPYYMKVESASVKTILVKNKGKFYWCVRAETVNLSYHSDLDEEDIWHLLNGGFWGHPEMMSIEQKGTNIKIKNRLYIIESKYDSEADAFASFEREPISLNGFCEDVFGDG